MCCAAIFCQLWGFFEFSYIPVLIWALKLWVLIENKRGQGDKEIDIEPPTSYIMSSCIIIRERVGWKKGTSNSEMTLTLYVKTLKLCLHLYNL